MYRYGVCPCRLLLQLGPVCRKVMSGASYDLPGPTHRLVSCLPAWIAGYLIDSLMDSLMGSLMIMDIDVIVSRLDWSTVLVV